MSRESIGPAVRELIAVWASVARVASLISPTKFSWLRATASAAIRCPWSRSS